nr:hypothetical protein [Corynebacterium xerosis]
MTSRIGTSMSSADPAPAATTTTSAPVFSRSSSTSATGARDLSTPRFRQAAPSCESNRRLSTLHSSSHTTAPRSTGASAGSRSRSSRRVTWRSAPG